MSSYGDFVIFLKEHNLYNREMFDYIFARMNFFDYRDEESRAFIGIFYDYDKSGRLIDFNLVTPLINDDITLLINIHEYIHAIEAYRKLNKVFIIDDDIEILPMLYEKIFVLERDNNKLTEYKMNLDKEIILNNNNYNRYLNGLIFQDILIKFYDMGLGYDGLKIVAKILNKKKVKKLFFNK